MGVLPVSAAGWFLSDPRGRLGQQNGSSVRSRTRSPRSSPKSGTTRARTTSSSWSIGVRSASRGERGRGEPTTGRPRRSSSPGTGSPVLLCANSPRSRTWCRATSRSWSTFATSTLDARRRPRRRRDKILQQLVDENSISSRPSRSDVGVELLRSTRDLRAGPCHHFID